VARSPGQGFRCTYCRIVTALARRIALRQEIVALYSAAEAQTIAI
jgi:hypothetical protein